MDIKVEFKTLHVPEEKKNSTHTWAVADVIANGVVIPNIRLINKATDEGMVHFFAFPRIKLQTHEYQDVLVLSKAQKEEIQQAIGCYIQDRISDERAEIEVKQMTLCEGKGKLLAVATVNINGIGVQGVRLFENEDHKEYVQFPQYKTRTGEWKNLVKVDSMFTVLALTTKMTQEYEHLSKEIQKQEPEIKPNLIQNKKIR